MKAFAYLRVSNVRQELSPKAQRMQLEAYCRVKGYELVHVFHETAISGGIELRERPEGSWLMALLDECDAVIFAKLDRAFRNTVDCILTADEIAAHGKTLHFLDMGIDTSTATGELCMTFLAGIARFERRRISDRIAEALQVVKQQGRKVGRAPYGSRSIARVEEDGRKVNAGLHEPVEEEAVTIKRIIAAKRGGESYRRIARELERDGVPTQCGGRWAAQTVKNIVMRTQV